MAPSIFENFSFNLHLFYKKVDFLWKIRFNFKKSPLPYILNRN